jgi:anti-sigma factor RsiW
MSHDHHPHPDCLALFEKLSEYIDKELDEATRIEIESHAAMCIQCKSCVETLKRTADLCGSLAEISVPQNFSKRLLSYLSSQIEMTPPKTP